MRDVYEARDADLGRNLRDALRPLRVHRIVGEVPVHNVSENGAYADGNALGLVFTADEIVDNVGMS